jgi:hypothetical protein
MNGSKRFNLSHILMHASLALSSAAWTVTAFAAPDKWIISEVAKCGHEKLRLARGPDLPTAANLGIFKAPLAVNTDGTPTSYHPDDFLGQRLAINRIDNGIAISRKIGKRLTESEKIEIFNRWRTSNWNVPNGYRIHWTNVILPLTRKDGHAYLLGRTRGILDR